MISVGPRRAMRSCSKRGGTRVPQMTSFVNARDPRNPKTCSSICAAHRRLQRSVVLDPLNPENHFELGASLIQARRFAEAIGAFKNVIALYPDDPNVNEWLGMAYYESGDFQSARARCEKSYDVNRPFCLALVYGKLGRRTDAETMLEAWRAEAFNSATSVAMILGGCRASAGSPGNGRQAARSAA